MKKPARGGLGVMMTTTQMIAVVLSPLIGGLVWWLFFRAGKAGHDFLWRKLPDGKLRRFLLKKIN